MWDLFMRVEAEVEAGECAPPVSAFERADRDSIRPFEAECITGVTTYRGMQHKFEKPEGRYHLGNPDIIAKFRQRRVDQFNEITQSMPKSGVRSIQQGEPNAIHTHARKAI